MLDLSCSFFFLLLFIYLLYLPRCDLMSIGLVVLYVTVKCELSAVFLVYGLLFPLQNPYRIWVCVFFIFLFIALALSN